MEPGLWVQLVLVLVAGVSALIAWRASQSSDRSADASERSAEAADRAAEAASRTAAMAERSDHRERDPLLETTFDTLGKSDGRDVEGARIHVSGPTGFSEVRAVLQPPEPGTSHFVERIRSLQTDESGGPGEALSLGSVDQGGELHVAFEFKRPDSRKAPSRDSGDVRVRLHLVNPNGEEWAKVVTVTVPPIPWVYSW